MTAALIALTLATTLLAYRINALHSHLVEHVDRQVAHLEGAVMASQQEVINALAEQVRRGTAEVCQRIADLQGQIDAGVPAEDLDLSELSAAAQALDNVVPDPVVDAPTE